MTGNLLHTFSRPSTHQKVRYPHYARLRYHLLLGRVALVRGTAGYSHQTFPWTICCLSVCTSVCPVHCGKTPDRIRIPFGIIGRTGPGMRQVVGFGDRSTGRGTFGGEFWVRHCNQWGLCLLYTSDAADE